MALRQRARFSWKPARLRRYHHEDQAPQQLRRVAFRALRRQIAEAWYRLWDLSTLFSFFIKAIPSTVRCGAIGGSEPRAAAKVLDAAGRPSFLGGNFEKQLLSRNRPMLNVFRRCGLPMAVRHEGDVIHVIPSLPEAG